MRRQQRLVRTGGRPEAGSGFWWTLQESIDLELEVETLRLGDRTKLAAMG